MHFNFKNSLLALFVFLSFSAQAQNGLNFQGVARNSNNIILASQPISLRLSIVQGTTNVVTEYTEVRKVTTNAQGLFNVVIGDTGTINVLGNFSAIDWKLTPKFLKIEMDVAAGNNFSLIGTTQFQSVAYAQFANQVDAEKIIGVVPVTKGGTGVTSLVALKSAMSIDKVSVGLSNVDNTSDASKPLSTAMQNALNLKLNSADTSSLSNRINQKEIISNKSSATDLGGISPSDVLYPTQKAVKTYVDAHANAGDVADGSITTIKLADAAVTDAKVATGISKSKVGLGSVDNTADMDKPISTAVADALNLKASTNVANVFTERQTINGTLGIIIPNTNNRFWYFDDSEQLIFPNNTKIEAGTSTETVIRTPINNDISILTSDGQEHALKFSSSGSLGINSFFEFSSGGDFILNGPNNTEGFIRVASIFGSPDFLNITHDSDIVLGNPMTNSWRLNIQNGSFELPNETRIESGTITETIIRMPDQNDLSFITTNYSSQNTYQWIFDNEGYTRFPGGDNIENDTYRFAINTENKRFQVVISDSVNQSALYWRFWEDGKLEFPDGSKFGDPEGPGTTGFLAADDNSFLIETNNTSNNPSVFSVWEFTKDGALVFPDGTITSGTISGTVNFGFDTRATENGFSILTGTSTGTAQLWTFDTNGVLNLPAGGDIKIGGSSVLSSGVNLMTEEFIVNLTPQSSNFGFDYINGTNYNVSGATPDRLMFPLQEVPQSLHQIVIYLDGRRIPKYDSSNQPLYYISGSAVVLIHDNFNYLIYDEGQDHIYRINIDYQY